MVVEVGREELRGGGSGRRGRREDGKGGGRRGG